MEYIAHRINTINELMNISPEHGVEIDLRDFGDRLILQHDPFKDGEDFEQFLNKYEHGTLILNIKSEGIEFKVKMLLKKYNIKNYFFLDSSFPMINLLSSSGEKKIALRFSEYEGVDTIINMKNKVNWVWVDCFTEFPLNDKIYQILKNKFKLCLVSPELQGYSVSKIKEFTKYLNNYSFDAICTKRIDLWKNEIGK